MLAAVRSDIGKVREINEDFTYVSELYPNGLLFAIVADGMGGHLAGEVASKTAVETVKEELKAIINQDLEIDEISKALESAIKKANEIVYQESLNNDKYKGMGTTIVSAIISPGWVLLAHIGDSRAYIILEDQIKQLTADHSLVNELLKNGQISEEEAFSHPQRNVLTRALGTELDVQIDINTFNWDKGNKLILCSDGLTDHFSTEELFELTNNRENLEEMVDELVALANKAGGADNISIIVVRND